MQQQHHPKNWLKLPNYLNLGTILPGQYGEAYLTFDSPVTLFLNIQLSQKAIHNSFFLLQSNSNECYEALNIIIKPETKKQLLIGCYPQQVEESKYFEGELRISENQRVHKIKLGFQVQIPRIKCLKMIRDITNNINLMKLIVNKAVTNDVRVSLFNEEKYPLTLQPGLLNKTNISDKTTPYVLKTHSGNVRAEPKQSFMIFLNLQTNIGFGKDLKGIKQAVIRNVLVLKTNSVLIWCLPIEITVIFVKQSEIKE